MGLSRCLWVHICVSVFRPCVLQGPPAHTPTPRQEKCFSCPSETLMKPSDPLLHLMYPNPLRPLPSLAPPQRCFLASNFLTPCLHFYTLPVSPIPLRPVPAGTSPPRVPASVSVAGAPGAAPIPSPRCSPSRVVIDGLCNPSRAH